MTDTNELRKALEGVSAGGDWKRHEDEGQKSTYVMCNGFIVCRIPWDRGSGYSAHRDAKFIATFSPPAVKELLDTVEQMQAERDAAFAMTNCECGPDEACRNLVAAIARAEAAEAELTRMTNNRDMYRGQCERQAKELERVRTVLAPFATCVFSDNGEVTIDTSRLTTQHYVAARHASNFADVEASRAVLKGTTDD